MCVEGRDQSHVQSELSESSWRGRFDVRCACPCQKENDGATDEREERGATTTQGDKEKISLPRMISE